MAVKLLLESTQNRVRNVSELREYLRKLTPEDFNVQKQAPEVFYKKVFLQVSQNSPENTCARILQLYYIRDPGTYVFPKNFAKIFGGHLFLRKTSERLLLKNIKKTK